MKKYRLTIISILILFIFNTVLIAKPRIMILMDEKNVGGYSINTAESSIANFLINNEYPVIDTDLVKTNLKRDQALQAMTGNTKAAAALGLEFGAEIVIVGRAISKGSATFLGKTSMRTYQGTVSVKVIKTDTAALIGTAQGRGSKPHVDDTAGGGEAIEIATKKMFIQLKNILDTRLNSSTNSSRTIKLVVGGVDQIWQLAAIRRILKEKVEGTSSVTQRSFISGVGTFEITTIKESQSFAEQIVMVNKEPFRIKVIGITANKVDAKLVMIDQ